MRSTQQQLYKELATLSSSPPSADQLPAIDQLLLTFFATHRIPVKDHGRDVVNMWKSALADLAEEQVASALLRFNRYSTEFPTPAAVRKHAVGLLSDEDRAVFAWGHVRRAMRSGHGTYGSINFSDKLINATIHAMGGWVRLGETRTDQIEWKRKEFIDTYCRVARHGVGDTSPLKGIKVDDPEPPVAIDVPLPEHEASPRLGYTPKAQPLIEQVASKTDITQ